MHCWGGSASRKGARKRVVVTSDDHFYNGYGGKGTLYTWAAGNGGDNGDNSNLEEYTNFYAITPVCAVNDSGIRSDFSELGANLWVCAPSNDLRAGYRGIVTIENSDFTTATYWTVCSDSVGQNSRKENGGARTAAMTAKLVSRWNPHILSYECLRVPPWLWFRRLPLLHWSATLQFALSHYVGVRVLLSLRSLGLW